MEFNISNHRKYREEIDGIRALAIIAVIINHFNKDFLPSGYLGVDIFFVISGYVITKTLFLQKIVVIFSILYLGFTLEKNKTFVTTSNNFYNFYKYFF